MGRAEGGSAWARQNPPASFRAAQAVTGIKLRLDFLISLIPALHYMGTSPRWRDGSFPS